MLQCQRYPIHVLLLPTDPRFYQFCSTISYAQDICKSSVCIDQKVAGLHAQHLDAGRQVGMNYLEGICYVLSEEMSFEVFFLPCGPMLMKTKKKIVTKNKQI